jgi:hypothetical protein
VAALHFDTKIHLTSGPFGPKLWPVWGKRIGCGPDRVRRLSKEDIMARKVSDPCRPLALAIVACLLALLALGVAAPAHAHGQTAHSQTVRGPAVVIVQPRHAPAYRHIVAAPPYGHAYGHNKKHRHAGYGRYVDDRDARRYRGFSTITLVRFNTLGESQWRAREQAQIAATTAPLAQTIAWNDTGASGTVTAVRDGSDTAGRYCREFQQTVTIGGQSERAYGTACQQPDGAWEVVATR